MSAIDSPNWLTIVGLLFVGCAVLMLVKSVAGSLERRYDDEGTLRAACQARVDGIASTPFLMVALMLLITGQFYACDLSAFIVLLALDAAVCLILYVGLEGLIVERALQHLRHAPSPHDRSASSLPASFDPRPPLHVVQSTSSA